MIQGVRRAERDMFAVVSVLPTFGHISGQDRIDAFVIACVKTVGHGLGECKQLLDGAGIWGHWGLHRHHHHRR